MRLLVLYLCEMEMNMKTRGMILIALLCVVSVSANAKTVFAIGNSIGVVVDNSVQFYSLDAKNYTSFVRSPNSDFSLKM